MIRYWFLMAREGYTTVAIPDELIKEVDAVLNLKKRGYKSRGEFAKEVVRQLLNKI